MHVRPQPFKCILCGRFSLTSTYAICPYGPLTLGRHQSSMSSWCQGKPLSCQRWAGSGGWLQQSHSEKPGLQRARCQCSDHTRSHSLDGYHTYKEDKPYRNITLCLSWIGYLHYLDTFCVLIQTLASIQLGLQLITQSSLAGKTKRENALFWDPHLFIRK